ncbi:MAG: hypothetical protein HYX90_08300 [Chloroflexi bacterium]|nr:hypothetical protein [Chloroflexota bacterium]
MGTTKQRVKKSAASPGMKYVHLYTGPDGKSHFKDVEVEFRDVEEGRKTSDLIKTRGLRFSVMDEDYEQAFHPSSRSQFSVTLEGEVEVVASNGTVRRFGPGDIMLADDKTGQGHINRVVSKHPRKVLVVTLE